MDQTPKQQVVERLKVAKNVAITTGRTPSVDDVVSVIGLGLMLKKLGKHVNMIVSQTLPKGIEFVTDNEPIEKTADNTRDFVIEFDRSKVDKLRYKKEDDIVKIFLTPYKSKIARDDFRFSQGDFNIDVVIAINVADRGQIDPAVAGEGRLLQEENVISMTAGSRASELMGINWQEPDASSVAEMLVSISEALQSNLLDDRISTALLAGIIAATDHFTNQATTPKVMTMAAQLMANGADQQKIMAELKKAAVVTAEDTNLPSQPKAVKPVAKKPTPASETENISNEDDMTVQLESDLQKEFNIDHEEEKRGAPMADDHQPAKKPTEPKTKHSGAHKRISAKDEIDRQADEKRPEPTVVDSAIDAQLHETQKLAKEKSITGFDLPATADSNPLIRQHQPSPLNQNVGLHNVEPAAQPLPPQAEQPLTGSVPPSSTSGQLPPKIPPPPVNHPVTTTQPLPPFGGQSHLNVHPGVPTLRTAYTQPHPPVAANLPASSGRPLPATSSIGVPSTNQNRPVNTSAFSPLPQPYPPASVSRPTASMPSNIAPQSTSTAGTSNDYSPAPSPGSEAAIQRAREAVANAVNYQQFNPAGQPLQSIGAQPMDETSQSVDLSK